MTASQRRYSLVLASPSNRFVQAVMPFLPDNRYETPVLCTDAAAVRKLLSVQKMDLALISMPLPDEAGLSLATDICAGSGMGVVLLTSAARYQETSDRAAPFGVMTLQKPTSGQLLTQALGIACATRERLRRMEEKNASIEEKMEEIRLVSHAKWVLIDQLKMSEPEAHRYIEKLAMDRCVTRRAVAQDILSIYK
ncbi:MAG: ANTAR domain-containing protein [Clostridiales bacterium]|nr:ANTAR domain-containing protein [Clostridiales bacterium]